MMGTVRCPMCGRENAVETVNMYRMCSGCGASMAVPAMAAQPAPPPPYASPPYGAPAGYQYPPQYPYPYPYPPPYPYAYPYAMGPPPSNHPGVYDAPDGPPRLDMGALGSVLFSPRDAFRRLYGHTDSRTGLMVFVLITLIEGLIALGFNLTVLSGAAPAGFNMFGSLGGGIAVVSFGVGIVTSLAMYIGVCYIVHALMKGGTTTLRPNLGKTIGLLGYAAMPSLVMGVLNTVVVGAISTTLDGSGDFDLTSIFAFAALALVLALVGLIWSLWVQGHAVSVANDAPWGKSAGMVFVSFILVGIIVFVVVMLIVAVLGFSAFQGV